MTKKEAIDILRKVAMKTPVDCTDIKEPKKFYEAIDLAIKALKFIAENYPKTFIDYLNGEQI